MQAWAYKFYSSTAWKKCRESYKTAMHRQCEICGGVGEIVHHKQELTPDNITDPYVTLSFRNLRLLCRTCHGQEHGNDVTATGVYFDERGDVRYSPPPSPDNKRGSAPQRVPLENTRGDAFTAPTL